MSYSCLISFKTIDPKDIYRFFQELKKAATDRIDQIALDSPSFSPIMKAYHFQDPFEITDQMRKDTERWAKESIFTYRYFYDAERSLLGVYSLPTCMRDLFDLTFGFQDSCEQDYDFEDWNGVSSFEAVADKWRNMPRDQVVDRMNKDLDPELIIEINDDQIDYYRKTFCYNEIWKTIEWTLNNDSSVLYLGLFGYWDFVPMQKFVLATERAVLKQIEEWKQEIHRKTNKKTKHIKEATFTSVWDGGVEITTNCKVNMETREIFDIEIATNDDVGSLDSLEEEYITIDGVRHNALNTADFLRIGKKEFWYEK